MRRFPFNDCSDEWHLRLRCNGAVFQRFRTGNQICNVIRWFVAVCIPEFDCDFLFHYLFAGSFVFRFNQHNFCVIKTD